MKDRKLLKAIAIAVAVLFAWNNLVWANPDILERPSAIRTETLGPMWRLQYFGIEQQSLMLFVDIAQEVIDTGVRADRIEEFIRDWPQITPELIQKIDFSRTRLAEDALEIGYRGTGPVCVMSFKKQPEHASGRIEDTIGKIQIADIIVEVHEETENVPEMPEGTSSEEAGDNDDVTGAAEGKITKHEGQKEFRSFFGRTIGKWFERWIGGWFLTDKPGVNDVIRQFWSGGRPKRGCTEFDDMSGVTKILENTEGCEELAEKIRSAGYKLYIYDIGRAHFIPGISTHYGIRTGSIHITRDEFERLRARGKWHVAARIAHEAAEIERWRKKSEGLIARGKISGLGESSRRYGTEWAGGIRGWIRSNCNEDGTGTAQKLDRKFHRMGLEKEIDVLVRKVFSLRKDMPEEKFYGAVRSLAHEYAAGKYRKLAIDPGAVVPVPGGLFHDIYTSILDGVSHFSGRAERKFFVNALYARVSLEYIKSVYGGLDDIGEGSNDFQNKTRKVVKRLGMLRESLKLVPVIDTDTRSLTDAWMDEMGAKVEYFPSRYKKFLLEEFIKVRSMLAEKNEAAWALPTPMDPEDIVGAADDEGAEEEASDPEGFGSEGSPGIAKRILYQKTSVTGPFDQIDSMTDKIGNYQNWNYRSISSGSTKSGSSSIGGGTKTSYIARYSNVEALIPKFEHARDSAKHILSDSGLQKLIGGTDHVRMFYGSRTGYFEVLDNTAEYTPQHEIEITVLADSNVGYEVMTYVPGHGETPTNIERAVKEFPGQISQVRLNIIGTDYLKRALMNDIRMPGDHVADLQRLFVKLVRQHVQVAGGNLFSSRLEGQDDDKKDFDDLIRPFENFCIREMTEQLDRVLERKADTEERKAKRDAIGSDDTESAEIKKQEKALAEANKALGDFNARYSGLPTIEEYRRKQQLLEQRLEKHNAELERLRGVYAQLEELAKKSEAEGLTSQESYTYKVLLGQYNKDHQAWQRLNKKLQEAQSTMPRIGELIGQRSILETKRDNIQTTIEALRKGILDEKALGAHLERDLHRLEREYEVLCKRIEDAQVKRQLAKGVIIGDRYRVLTEIGEGGFGVVYRVHDTRMKVYKAMKILDPTGKFVEMERTRQDFDNEIKAYQDGSQKGAPTPSIEATGTYAGMPYMVMQLVSGRTVNEIIEDLKKGLIRMSRNELIFLTHALALVLARYHEKAGSIHRDIKGGNIMVPVNPDGSPAIPKISDREKLLESSQYDSFVSNIMIIDLGLSLEAERTEDAGDGNRETRAASPDQNRHTKTGGMVGTPHFWAPEQASGMEPITEKTDVYALGALLYELWTRHLPVAEGIPAQEYASIAYAQVHEKPVLISQKIKEENKRLESERKENRMVNLQALEGIKKGLVKKLSRITERKRAFMRKREGVYYWLEELMDENTLKQRLSQVRGLTDEEKDAIVASVIIKVPEIDPYIEHLIHRMLEKPSRERPRAHEAAVDIDRYLRGNKEKMKYKPRSHVWAKLRHTALILFLACVAGGALIWMAQKYSDSIRKDAQEEVKSMKADVQKLLAEKEKYAAEREKFLKERTAIEESLKELQAQKTAIGQEKATLAEQVAQLKEQAAKAIELEKKKTELEARAKELEASVAKLAQQEADAKKKKAELDAQKKEIEDMLARAQTKLREAEEQLARYRNSLPGIGTDALAAARDLEGKKALRHIRRIPWWTIEQTNGLNQFTNNLDAVSKRLADNGQFADAVEIEEQRIKWLEQVAGWEQSAKKKLPFHEAAFKAHRTIIALKRASGDIAGAGKYLRELMKKKPYSDSKQWSGVMRAELIETLLAGAYAEKDAEKKKAMLRKAGELAEGIEDKYEQYGCLARIYLAGGEYRSAAKYFGSVHENWADKARERDIAPADKTAREAMAARALTMKAFTYTVQALEEKSGGNEAGKAAACKNALEALDRVNKDYGAHKEVMALALLVRGDVLSLQGNAAEAAKVYEAARALAAANKQKVLQALIRSRLRKKLGLDDLADTYSALVSGEADIPLAYLAAVMSLLDGEAREYRWGIEERKRAEEEKRRKEEEARRRAEAEKRKAEREARKKAEEEAFVKKVLEGVKTLDDVKVRLVQVNKEINTLTSNLGTVTDRAERKRVEEQLERARKKKQILEDMRKMLAPEKDETAPEGDAGAMLTPHQSPIANDLRGAPDHRLVNAVIRRAMLENRFSQDKGDGITVLYLGSGDTSDMRSLYNRLAEKDKVFQVFRDACREDGLVDAEISALFGEGMLRLGNIKGHAGIDRSVVYVCKGVKNIKRLVDHEKEELKLHKREIARSEGFVSWRQIRPKDKKAAIKRFRERPDYNDIALALHEEANAKYPVDGAREIVADSGITYAPDAGRSGYERPIAGEGEEADEPVSAEWDEKTMISIIGKISEALTGFILTALSGFTGTVPPQAQGKGVVIFADDILDSSAVFDLDRLAEVTGKKGSLLGKIVLYAKTPLKADLVEKVIKERNPDADVAVILEEDVRGHYGGDFYRTPRIEAVLRYSMNTKCGIFTKPDQILGVVRGPLRKGEDADAIREELRRSSMKVPVVMFEDAGRGNVYSIMQAVSKLMEIRLGGQRKGLLFILPPLTRVSEALQKEYEKYRYMLKALEAAA